MTSTRWPDGFSLRPMTDADILTVHKLESTTNPNPWTIGIIRNCLTSRNNCWLLEKDGELAGYGVTMVTLDEGHLLNIAISPNYQRQGLGLKLLEFLADDVTAKNAKVFFLEVRVSNTVAINLYENYGFCEVGIRKGYYPGTKGREDAIVMMQDLVIH